MLKLYEHQIEALNVTEKFNRCAYYFDMQPLVLEKPLLVPKR